MSRRALFWASLLALCGLAAACGGATAPTPTPEPNPIDRAAAEATAIVQQARATAIVLEAHAQATALVEQAQLAGSTPTSAVDVPVPDASPAAAPTAEAAQATADDSGEASRQAPEQAVPSESGVAIPVQVTSVSFAAEGGMIMVRFQAPPEEAEKWWPGTVSVTDEGNGAVYDEIPVMPKIGPLIGRPKRAGQAGYVMLTNAPPYLQAGALVTVVLGAHEFEHVPVQ